MTFRRCRKPSARPRRAHYKHHHPIAVWLFGVILAAAGLIAVLGHIVSWLRDRLMRRERSYNDFNRAWTYIGRRRRGEAHSRTHLASR